MHNKVLSALYFTAVLLFLFACSKKTVPVTAGKPAVTYNGKVIAGTTTATTTKTTARRIVVKRAPVAVPNVIMVNDKAAKKNIDGRLYYDVNGHRYWRNYDDGKYYLFSQAMYYNPAFKPH